MCHATQNLQKVVRVGNASQGASALMIDGARRVGESWIAEDFAI